MKALLLLIPIVLIAYIPPTTTPVAFDETSVLILCKDSLGSGVVFHNGDYEFIWTAAHVVSSAEKQTKSINIDTLEEVIDSKFDDVQVVRHFFKDGNKSGENSRNAEIIRFSDPYHGYDLALLKTSHFIAKKSCEFAEKEPEIGDDIYYIGSPSGYFNMYIKGHVMADRRGYFTQVNLAVTGGASGGPIFSFKDNKVLGLVTLVNEKQRCLAFAVSTTIIRKYAKECNCEWAINNNIKVPDEFRLKSPRTSPIK